MQLSKKNEVQKILAKKFFVTKIGERIATISDLQKELGVGTGTIQSAIKEFESLGVVQIKAQPRYGTVLEDKNMGQLWQYLQKNNIVGLMPSPISLEMQGLAMGLREEFHKQGIPLILVYGYGSSVRFDKILSEVSEEDFVVSSVGSAIDRQKTAEQLEMSLKFGAHSFYEKDSLVIVSNRPILDKNEKLRIGIDYRSYDHMILTKAIFPNQEYVSVDVEYENVPLKVTKGEIDCAIWHKTKQTNLVISESIYLTDIDLDQSITEEISEAVLTINHENEITRAVLEHIDLTNVHKIQTAVISEGNWRT